MIDRVVCWNTVLTDHQAPLYRELNNLYPTKVFVFDKEDISRKKQGWTAVDSTGLDIHNIKPRIRILKAVRELIRHQADIHIFGSPFDNLGSIALVFVAALMRMRFFLICEAFNTTSTNYLKNSFSLFDSVRAVLRPVVYKCYSMVLKNRVSGIFAISATAVAQYKYSGIALGKIFPFAYFPYFRFKADYHSVTRRDKDSELRLIFVGALIPRKGLASLLAAVSKLREKGWKITLDCYGAGDASTYRFAAPSSTYCGTLHLGSAPKVISQYDLLILPSLFDGWGVVCNEAVLVGVPLVCSTGVGFSGVVQKWRCGLTYALSDAGGLEDALLTIVSNPDLLDRMRENAMSVAACLEPSFGAQYVADSIRYVFEGGARPSAIWYDTD